MKSSRTIYRISTTLAILPALLFGACELEDEGFEDEFSSSERADENYPNFDEWKDLYAKVRPGDILMYGNGTAGCNHSSLEGVIIDDLNFCHAALVYDKNATIEGLGEGYSVSKMKNGVKNIFADHYNRGKLVLLRPKSSSKKVRKEVVQLAKSWVGKVRYDLSRSNWPSLDAGDDMVESGTYCSHLVYRAWLDAAGLSLKNGAFQVVSPDDLNFSSNTKTIFQLNND